MGTSKSANELSGAAEQDSGCTYHLISQKSSCQRTRPVKTKVLGKDMEIVAGDTKEKKQCFWFLV